MWAIIKFDKKNFNFFKRELKMKLSCEHVLYCPKILIQKYKNNKLIEKEFEHHKIKLSDISLSKLIKIQKEFNKENEFSRTEYEKFLILNNLDAVSFEKNLSNKEK